jgi:hypothetical protein
MWKRGDHITSFLFINRVSVQKASLPEGEARLVAVSWSLIGMLDVLFHGVIRKQQIDMGLGEQ